MNKLFKDYLIYSKLIYLNSFKRYTLDLFKCYLKHIFKNIFDTFKVINLYIQEYIFYFLKISLYIL